MADLPFTGATLHSTDDAATLVEDLPNAKGSKLMRIAESNDEGKLANGDATDVHHVEEDEGEDDIEELIRVVRRKWSYSVPEIDVESFVEFLLPRLQSSIHVDDILSLLKAEGCIGLDDKWTHFGATPSKRPGRTDAVFTPLAEICGRSIYHASNAVGLEPTLTFSLLPAIPPSSCGRCAARPSGYFILKEAEDRARNASDRKDRMRWWHDIALTTEFRKYYTYDELDDVSYLFQVVSH